MKPWNALTHAERLAKIPDLVNILAEGRDDVYRGIMAAKLADIGKTPDALLNLMRPYGQPEPQTPPMLAKLLAYVDFAWETEISAVSAELVALAVASGIPEDRIVDRRIDTPGIVIQTDGGEPWRITLISNVAGEYLVVVHAKEGEPPISVSFASDTNDAVRIASEHFQAAKPLHQRTWADFQANARNRDRAYEKAMADIEARRSDAEVRGDADGVMALNAESERTKEAYEATVFLSASEALAWMAVTHGFTEDQIVDKGDDAPGIVIQLGVNKANQATITEQGGKWTVTVDGPAFLKADTMSAESAQEALHIVGKLLDIYEEELANPDYRAAAVVGQPTPITEAEIEEASYLTASDELAAQVKEHGFTEDQILGRRIDGVGILIRLDVTDEHRAMLNKTSDGGWTLHLGGPGCGKDGSTLVFANVQDTIDAMTAFAGMLTAPPAIVASTVADSEALAAMAERYGVQPGFIVGFGANSPAISISLDDDNNDEAVVLPIDGQWALRIRGDRFENGGADFAFATPDKAFVTLKRMFGNTPLFGCGKCVAPTVH